MSRLLFMLRGFRFAPLVLSCGLVGVAYAQQAPAPVVDYGRVLMQGQLRTGIALRELDRARYAMSQAEQDVTAANQSYQAAVNLLAQRKQALEQAQQSFVAAKEKFIAAQKSYDGAINAVDDVYRGTSGVPKNTDQQSK